MDESTKITIETYNRTAKEFSDNTKDLHHFEAEEYFLTHAKGKKLLDVGSGDGRDAKFFSNHGFDVTGVDLSDALIALAKENAPKAHFVKMDMRALDFPPDSFDAVWMVTSLLHVPKKDVPKTLATTCKVMKKGALLYICVKIGDGETQIADKRYDEKAVKFYSYFSPTEMKQLVIDAGLRILSFVEFKHPHSYVDRAQIRLIATKI